MPLNIKNFNYYLSQNNILILSFILLSIPRYTSYGFFFDYYLLIKIFITECFILIFLFFLNSKFILLFKSYELNFSLEFKISTKIFFFFILFIFLYFSLNSKTDFIINYAFIISFILYLFLNKLNRIFFLFFLFLVMVFANEINVHQEPNFSFDNYYLKSLFDVLLRSSIVLFVIFFFIFKNKKIIFYFNILLLSLILLMIIICYSVFHYLYMFNLNIYQIINLYELPYFIYLPLYKLLIRVDFIYNLHLSAILFNDIKLDFDNFIILKKLISPLTYLSNHFSNADIKNFELADFYGDILSRSTDNAYQKFNFDINLWFQLYRIDLTSIILFILTMLISFYPFQIKFIINKSDKFFNLLEIVYLINILYIISCFIGLSYQDSFLEKAFLVNIFNIFLIIILKIKKNK